MIVTPGCLQNIGARASQQDAFIFSNIDDRRFANHAGVLAVVADGMGGMANGGEASHMAVKVFHDSYMTKTAGETIPQALDRALQDANKAVYQYAKSTGQAENTGTTLVAAVVHEHNLYWISVGDSRLYLCRRGKLTQVNEEHLYAHELDRDAAAGKITQDEARNNPERHALTSYLGQPKPEEIDRNAHPFPLEGGDRLLLCSDGLYAALSDQEMAQTLAGKPQNAADALIAQVLNMKRPGQDNLTVAILGCEEEPVGGREGGADSPSEDGQPTRSKARVVVAMFLSLVAVFGIGVGGIWWYQTQKTEAPGVPFLDWLSAKWQPDEPKSDNAIPRKVLPVVAAPQPQASSTGKASKSTGEGGDAHGKMPAHDPKHEEKQDSMFGWVLQLIQPDGSKTDSPKPPVAASGVAAPRTEAAVETAQPAISAPVSGAEAEHSSGVAPVGSEKHSGVVKTHAPVSAASGEKKSGAGTTPAAVNAPHTHKGNDSAVKKKGDTAPPQNASIPRDAAASQGGAPSAGAHPNPAAPANPAGKPKAGDEGDLKMTPTLTNPPSATKADKGKEGGN